MGSRQSSQNSGSEVKKGDVATVVGGAVAAVSVIDDLLRLFGGSSSTNGAVAAVSAVGGLLRLFGWSSYTSGAVAAVSVIGGLLRLFGGSSSANGGKTMKAPGRDFRIFRKDFENDPATYFRDLRK